MLWNPGICLCPSQLNRGHVQRSRQPCCMISLWNHLGARLTSWVTDTILVIFASTNVLWSSLNSLLLVWTAWHFMKMSEHLLLLIHCPVVLGLALCWLVDSSQQDLRWSPPPSEPLLTPVYCLTSAPLRGSMPSFHIIFSSSLLFFPWPWAVSLYLHAGQHLCEPQSSIVLVLCLEILHTSHTRGGGDQLALLEVCSVFGF